MLQVFTSVKYLNCHKILPVLCRTYCTFEDDMDSSGEECFLLHDVRHITPSSNSTLPLPLTNIHIVNNKSHIELLIFILSQWHLKVYLLYHQDQDYMNFGWQSHPFYFGISSAQLRRIQIHAHSVSFVHKLPHNLMSKLKQNRSMGCSPMHNIMPMKNVCLYT